MNETEFEEKVFALIKPELKLQNPGGGQSIIKNISEAGNICYQRGNSKIYVNIKDLYDAYNMFRGRKCSSNDLKAYNPSVFDSTKGRHNCNCTFFFSLLKEIHIIKEIKGTGTRGSPFYIEIAA
ncbi:hypothetical protein H0R92_06015 [Treponema sp. OMZ 840]|uniref:hypothetical protein n=1 Tax=Treponema sp. OMZ 840 TaxID=244313 RepID=UPI003D8C44F9